MRERLNLVTIEKFVTDLCNFFEFAELFHIEGVSSNGMVLSDKTRALFRQDLNLQFRKLTKKIKLEILNDLAASLPN